MAAAYLDVAFAGEPPEALAVVIRNQARWHDVIELARAGVNSPLTSSAGRLFDAVAAILGIRDVINYEGQAAVELEQRADPGEHGAYDTAISSSWLLGSDLVRAVAEDELAGVPTPTIAARFHNGVAAAIVRVCLSLSKERGLRSVALSGGVFQNLLLLRRTSAELDSRGFRTLVHTRVPCNDGGISLGQAAIAGARDRRGSRSV